MIGKANVFYLTKTKALHNQGDPTLGNGGVKLYNLVSCDLCIDVVMDWGRVQI